MKRFLVFLLALMAIVHTPAPLPIHKTITRHPLQHLITLESAMKSLAKGPMPKPPISIFSIRLQRRKIPELIWREWWEMQENGCMTVHKSVNAETESRIPILFYRLGIIIGPFLWLTWSRRSAPSFSRPPRGNSMMNFFDTWMNGVTMGRNSHCRTNGS